MSDNQTLIWFTIGPIYILRISLEGKLIEVHNIHKIPVGKHLFKVKKKTDVNLAFIFLTFYFIIFNKHLATDPENIYLLKVTTETLAKKKKAK